VSVGVTWREDSGWLVRAGADTQRGNYRESNEDRFHLDPRYPFALVLDGMGGPGAGELASRAGAEAVAAALRRGLKAGEPRGLIERALRDGHEAILALGSPDHDMRNCGATIVLALLHDGVAHVSWLGDSAAFLVSGDHVEKFTWDHDYRTCTMRKLGMSEEEARGYFWKNVLLYYLGQWPEGDVQLEVPSRTFNPGDRLVLATDGVAKLLAGPELLRVCRSHPEPQACAEELVRLALERGSRDNCTCAVIAFGRPGDPPPALPPPPRRWWRFWH
jgi:protein phosphatase